MKKNRLSYPTGPVMRINGQTVSLTVAKLDYRCAECLGELRYRDGSVVCKSIPAHAGFVHKKDAAKLQARQSVNIQSLSDVYQIIDGKVVIKNDN